MLCYFVCNYCSDESEEMTVVSYGIEEPPEGWSHFAGRFPTSFDCCPKRSCRRMLLGKLLLMFVRAP